MKRRALLGGMLVCAVGLAWALGAQESRKPLVVGSGSGDTAGSAKPEVAEVKWAPAVKPKPLSENVKRGVNWLVEHQLKSGAWGQGEESTAMGGGVTLKDVPSVADTCMAAMALMRAGSTPAKGEHSNGVLAAVKYVCGQVEESSQDTLEITTNRGTRVQSKLGPYIDTFAASLLLAEVNNQMPDAASQKRVAAALDKLLAKIQKNQRPDGTWGGEGWAPTLQQNMAVKGLNRAVQNGAAMVDDKVREKAELQARQSFDRASGKFSAAGSAGVELYSAGATLNNLSNASISNGLEQTKVREQAQNGATADARQQAQTKLDRFKAADKDLADAERAVIARLDDKQFIAGFGSNGGEEFLSYMNIGESLVVKGGDTWKSWDKSITENINRVQNNDGSWSGHHCITGRTFCTSAALLVLMVDRSPVPLSAKMKRR
jgi:hypothetical protein